MFCARPPACRWTKLNLKFGLDRLWTPVLYAYLSYCDTEKQTLRSGIASARQLAESTQASAEATQQQATQAVNARVGRVEAGVRKVRADIAAAAAASPEGVVAASTMLFANARGAWNGTLLGRSPRLTVLFAAAMTMRQWEPLERKWDLSSVVVRASAACSARAHALLDSLGLLPRSRGE